MSGHPDHEMSGGVWTAAFVAGVIEGEPHRAAKMIQPVLASLDPDTAPPDVKLAALAGLWAVCAVHEPDVPEVVLRWARYSVRASIRVHGPKDEVTRRARMALAGVKSRRGEHLGAARQYARVAANLRACGEAREAALVQALRAAELHAGGRCQAGVNVLTSVWLDCPTPTGTDATAGQERRLYRDQLVGMLLACGRVHDAQALTAATEPATTRRAPTTHTTHTTHTDGDGLDSDDSDGDAPAALLHALVCEWRRHTPPAGLPKRSPDWRDLLP